MKEQICRYNKFGYCKYGDKCHFRHINEKCVIKDCKIQDCEKRHTVDMNMIRLQIHLKTVIQFVELENKIEN